MAVKIVRVTCCDICGEEKNLSTFRVTERGVKSKAVTLCDSPDHGAPVIRNLVDLALKQPGLGTARRPGRVASMDEVAKARKSKAQKPA